ncbi:MAG: SMI1/KNR4 family protein, partial [Ktedonobacterales bacterium]|nr:SMI1/KNR4 family protein [Ktedonobacterales bacterium]
GPGYGLYQLPYAEILKHQPTYWEKDEMTYLHTLTLTQLSPNEPYLAICCDGCGFFYFINCSQQNPPVIFMDKLGYGYVRIADSLAEWLGRWLAGELPDPEQIEEPVRQFILREMEMQRLGIAPLCSFTGVVTSPMVSIYSWIVDEFGLCTFQGGIEHLGVFQVFMFNDRDEQSEMAIYSLKETTQFAVKGSLSTYHFTDKDGAQQSVPALIAHQLLSAK